MSRVLRTGVERLIEAIDKADATEKGSNEPLKTLPRLDLPHKRLPCRLTCLWDTLSGSVPHTIERDDRGPAGDT